VASKGLPSGADVFAAQVIRIVVFLTHQDRLMPKLEILARALAGTPIAVQLDNVLLFVAFDLTANQEPEGGVVRPHPHTVKFPVQARFQFSSGRTGPALIKELFSIMHMQQWKPLAQAVSTTSLSGKVPSLRSITVSLIASNMASLCSGGISAQTEAMI
jgi:hypothetical protein